MNVVIRKINDNEFLLITLNENLTVKCRIVNTSELTNIVSFSEDINYFCDEKTMSIMDQNMILPKDIKVVFNIHQKICDYLYDSVAAYANTNTNLEFFNVIQKYLIGNNKKLGSNKIEKRKKSIFTELLNSSDFIKDFSNLWFSFTSSNILPYTKSEKNIFVEKIASLINEILTATDTEIKKEKQAELDRHFRAEKQLKNHIFRISR